MDPIRRLIFLALLVSVVTADSTQARALSAAVIADADAARPTLVPGSWIKRLSALLRRTVRPAARTGPRRRRSLLDVARAVAAPLDLGRHHATFAAHAFRLPPPLAIAA